MKVRYLLNNDPKQKYSQAGFLMNIIRIYEDGRTQQYMQVCARNCARDERGGPSAGLQEQASNHLKLRWLRARGVSVKEKSRQRTVAGVYREDERKRTTDEVSKIYRWCQNRGSYLVSG